MNKSILKKFMAMVLVLSMLLVPVSSLAEAVFGELTANAFQKAWSDGKEIAAAISLGVKMEDVMLGGSMQPDPVMNTITKTLDTAQVNVSAVNTPDGIRLKFEAVLKDTVITDATLVIGADMVSVQSSLIEGKQISVSYEKLASMSPYSPEMIQLVLTDIANYAVANASSYVTIVGEWFATLETVQGSAEPATDACDEIVASAQINIKVKDIANIVLALANQVKADTELKNLLAKYGVVVAADLDAQLGEMIDQITNRNKKNDETALVKIVIGLDASSAPVYMVLGFTDGEGSGWAYEMQIKTTEEGPSVTISANAVDGDESTKYVVVSQVGHPSENVMVGDVYGRMTMDLDDAKTQFDFVAQTQSEVLETSETLTYTQSMNGSVASKESSANMALDATITFGFNTVVDGDDFTSIYLQTIAYNEPIAAEMSCSVEFASQPYEPQTVELTNLNFFELTVEELKALVNEIEASLKKAADTAFTLLPQEIGMMVNGINQ